MKTHQNIQELFEEQAVCQPKHVAAIAEDQSLNYHDLNKKANQLAHYLREEGVIADTPVALCIERSIDLLIIILAILKAGGGYVPLDPSHPEKRLLFILKDNNNPLIITTSTWREKFKTYPGKLILVDEETQKISDYSPSNLNLPIKPNNLAYIIYTSGSTGVPKGVLVEQGSLINYCLWFADFCDCHPKQRIDFSSNYIFDLAVTISIIPLMLGLTVVICDEKTKKDPRCYLQYLKKNKVNIIKLTPSYFRVLTYEVKNNFIKLPHLNELILGGENLRTADCEAWFTCYPSTILINEYGPTEATVGVTLYEISQKTLNQLGKDVPIGEPGTNIQLHILDKEGILVPDGEIGELYIGGACLARGYLNQYELTQEKFVNNPFSKKKRARLYKTGDLCRRLPDGAFECVGRIDHQIKIRGYRIELGEIEKCLIAHPAVKDAVALARDNQFHEKWIVGYYILKEVNNSPSVDEIRHHLGSYLPDYMIPAALVSVDFFPLTANGKLDHYDLPAPQFSCSQHYLPPRTKLEKILVDIWSEEFELKPIGIKDNFFELGGHSLSAARIVAKIKDTLGKEITLSDFYQQSTIFGLASVVKNLKNSRRQKRNFKQEFTQNAKTMPLSDFQLMLWLSNTFELKAKKLNIVARKRIQGQLDIVALNFALAAVLKKQEVLSYRVLKLRPAQCLQKDLSLKITEKNLSALSKQESELALLASLNELIHYYPWPKNLPMIRIELFHLKNNIKELHIAMSHSIADNNSPELFFADLSQFYFLYINKLAMEHLTTYKQYKDYVITEQQHIHEYLDRDINFWENYLKDATLLTLPTTKIINNREAQEVSYSTYQEIPEQVLKQLQQFCAENHVTISEALCAAVGLTLTNCCANTIDTTKKISMNQVKSTRDNQAYDEVIGCFLRIEPIKLDLNKTFTLTDLCRQVRQATIDTAHYQPCSSLIKLACLSVNTTKVKLVSSYLIRGFIYLYMKLLCGSKLNYEIFRFFCERLISFERKNKFLININVWNNFIMADRRKDKYALFGLKSKTIPHYRRDLLKINNVLDVCFLRDENQNVPYLVISANLKPVFRKQLAREIIKVIQYKMLTTEKT